MPSRIVTRACSSLFRAAVSTSVVPLFRDRPPFARVLVLRAAAPDSTVSLPQGSTVLTGLCPKHSQCFTLAEPGHNSSAASHTPPRTPGAETPVTGIRTGTEGK
ncbi:hypothetical protein GCM10010446_08010 [Streptomyces enissocaesilis]|uniref:Uncharacterized protein n=1 Tax=Streptomyces enissocaesilis TaxID=332589 RepID=A0ABN3WTI3_9ACTN